MTPSGTGHAGCHHGEILQGAFLDEDGHRRLGLVTLPRPEPVTRAEFVRRTPSPPEDITVLPEGRPKAHRAARIAVQTCAALAAQPPSGGRLTVHSTVPIGLGMGSSTSDVIATIRAVAHSFEVGLRPELVAEVAVRAERASDPLMLDDRPVLFAHRQARVLEVFGNALPPVTVLGCLTGQGLSVDTLAVPADHYGDEDVRLFEDLRARMRTAITTADVALLGRIATASAQRHQSILDKPELDTLLDIVDHIGAAGVQIAHSGNVAGLLFDPQDPDLQRRLRHGTRLLDSHGLPSTGTFTAEPSQKTRHHAHPHQRRHRPARPGAGRRRAGLPTV